MAISRTAFAGNNTGTCNTVYTYFCSGRPFLPATTLSRLRKNTPDCSPDSRIQEDEVIIDIAHDALEQDYPPDSYDVVIIADSFLPETIQKLGTLPVKVIEVSFESSTKSKALNKAMETTRG
jgi:hypothetical protein